LVAEVDHVTQMFALSAWGPFVLSLMKSGRRKSFRKLVPVGSSR
jgi:hypothetical protein